MISQIFIIIRLILTAFGLWESFLSYGDANREKKRVEKDQKRDKAVDEQKDAQTEEEFDKNQDTIGGSKP